MTAGASEWHAALSPDAYWRPSGGVGGLNGHIETLQNTIALQHPNDATAAWLAESQAHGKLTPLEAMLESATKVGAAVAHIRCEDAATSVRDFVASLSTGRAPVISPASARLLEALHGRHVAQVRFLEDLLRRHARHRTVFIVFDGPRGLDEDTARLLLPLRGLLHDVPVIWLLPSDFEAVAGDLREPPHGRGLGRRARRPLYVSPRAQTSQQPETSL